MKIKKDTVIALCLTITMMFMGTPAAAFAVSNSGDESKELSSEQLVQQREQELVERYGTSDIRPVSAMVEPELATAVSAMSVSRIPNRYAAPFGWEEVHFGYTGGVQSWSVPYDNLEYKLEVWGAQGGGQTWGSPEGAYGGYAIGTLRLNDTDTLYIAVGGKGGDGGGDGSGGGGGWNGGGSAGTCTRANNLENDPCSGGGGGGATHIALNSNHGQLRSFPERSDDILMVADGGGGWGCTWERGGPGEGGGTNGGSGIDSEVAVGGNTAGGSQTSAGGGGGWGYGGNGGGGVDHGPESAEGCSGGGGGWYGGGACQTDFNTWGWNSRANSSGGGGSGHVNTSKLYGTSMSNGANWGNGEALISYQSAYTVRYNGNNSTSGYMSDSTFHMGVNETLKANEYSRTGYIFLGWATSTEHATNQIVDWADQAQSTSFGATEPLQVINLYAVWKPRTSTVTFYQNASSTDSRTAQVTYTYDVPNQRFDIPAGFAKTGYTQTGWCWDRHQNNNVTDATTHITYAVNSSGQQSPAFTQAQMNQWILDHEGSATLYATWKPNHYTMHIYHNGGASWGGASYYDREVIYDHSKFNELTREATEEQKTNPGKTFDGYWTAASGGTQVYTQYGLAKNDSNYWLNGYWHRPNDVSLYAHWK